MIQCDVNVCEVIKNNLPGVIEYNTLYGRMLPFDVVPRVGEVIHLGYSIMLTVVEVDYIFEDDAYYPARPPVVGITTTILSSDPGYYRKDLEAWEFMTSSDFIKLQLERSDHADPTV